MAHLSRMRPTHAPHMRRMLAAVLVIAGAVLLVACGPAADSTPSPASIADAPPPGTTPTGAPAPLPATFSIYDGTGASSEERVPVTLDYGKAEIGYLPHDTIRPIYAPEFVGADAARLKPGDFVIGLALNGEARAYPIDILWTREMVNDWVGGIPVLVTW